MTARAPAPVARGLSAQPADDPQTSGHLPGAADDEDGEDFFEAWFQKWMEALDNDAAIGSRPFGGKDDE